MKRKIQISESMLREMIVRAINESMFGGSSINPHEAIENWALAVRDGEDPIHCKEFRPFYQCMFNDYRCKQAVKAGVAKENKNQSMAADDDMEERKPSIMVDRLFNETGVCDDILQDFFSGLNCIVKEDSKPDSFKGDNVFNCVDVYFRGSESEFFTYLCKLLLTYSSHYFRKHYNEWVVQYGRGSSKIGGNEPDYDQYTGEEMENNSNQMDYSADSVNGGGENSYFEKMVATVKNIVANENIGLTPQERLVLNTLVEINTTQISPENLEKMQGLSQTQQNQVIYQEISNRTGVTLDRVKKSLSSAIIKAREYAARKRVMKEQIINEVMRRIMDR